MLIKTKKNWTPDALRKKLAQKFEDYEVKTIAQNVMVKNSAAMVHIRIGKNELNIYGSLNSTHLLSYIGIILAPFSFIILKNRASLFIAIITSLLATILYFFLLWQTQKKKAKNMEEKVIKILSVN